MHLHAERGDLVADVGGKGLGDRGEERRALVRGLARRLVGAPMRAVAAVNASNDPAFGWTGVRLEDAVDALERTTDWLLGSKANDPDPVLAGATPYLRLFALTAGGALLAQEALAAKGLGGNGADAAARIALARFFAENLAVQAGGLERTVVEGADSVNRADAALA